VYNSVMVTLEMPGDVSGGVAVSLITVKGGGVFD